MQSLGGQIMSFVSSQKKGRPKVGLGMEGTFISFWWPEEDRSKCQIECGNTRYKRIINDIALESTNTPQCMSSCGDGGGDSCP